ncbi:MAG: hypothetical protein WCG42_06355 [Parachlamydiaceae bacterium]
METSRSLTEETCSRDDLIRKKDLQEELLAGNSYQITGLNTGKGNGYAFNIFQQSFLPSELTPPPGLCGHVES